MGAGSNLLVRDGGIDGVVIKLSTHMKEITHDGTCIRAQTGATDADVVRYARGLVLAYEFIDTRDNWRRLAMNAGAWQRVQRYNYSRLWV